MTSALGTSTRSMAASRVHIRCDHLPFLPPCYQSNNCEGSNVPLLAPAGRLAIMCTEDVASGVPLAISDTSAYELFGLEKHCSLPAIAAPTAAGRPPHRVSEFGFVEGAYRFQTNSRIPARMEVRASQTEVTPARQALTEVHAPCGRPGWPQRPLPRCITQHRSMSCIGWSCISGPPSLRVICHCL